MWLGRCPANLTLVVCSFRNLATAVALLWLGELAARHLRRQGISHLERTLVRYRWSHRRFRSCCRLSTAHSIQTEKYDSYPLCCFGIRLPSCAPGYMAASNDWYPSTRSFCFFQIVSTANQKCQYVIFLISMETSCLPSNELTMISSRWLIRRKVCCCCLFFLFGDCRRGSHSCGWRLCQLSFSYFHDKKQNLFSTSFHSFSWFNLLSVLNMYSSPKSHWSNHVKSYPDYTHTIAWPSLFSSVLCPNISVFVDSYLPNTLSYQVFIWICRVSEPFLIWCPCAISFC